jgi:hypothetical protein
MGGGGGKVSLSYSISVNCFYAVVRLDEDDCNTITGWDENDCHIVIGRDEDDCLHTVTGWDEDDCSSPTGWGEDDGHTVTDGMRMTITLSQDGMNMTATLSQNEMRNGHNTITGWKEKMSVTGQDETGCWSIPDCNMHKDLYVDDCGTVKELIR